jgi:glycerol-3-phosphate dehydrogenase
VPTPSATAHEPLAGGALPDLDAEIAAATAAVGDAAVATRLVHAHGDAWRAVWAPVRAAPALAEPIEASRPYLLAELRYAVRHEMALTLGDLLVRRTPVAFETRDHGRGAARRVVPHVAQWLGWRADDVERAIAAYDAESRRIFTID